MSLSTDLAKARHELRTPINHILGYCEILLEEEEMPEGIVKDLRKIWTGGKELLGLISRYLDDATFGRELDWHQVQHELRTPVNHIIGYTELLLELASEMNQPRLLADLDRIRSAAAQWLSRMESHLSAAMETRIDERASRPASDAATESGPDQERPRASASILQSAILIVDDDQGSRELLARRLHRHGFRVATAGSGTEALELLQRRAVDLLLVDSIMPEMDGLELLRRVRETHSRTELPVIMVTGRDASGEVAKALQLGANDYITKPVDFEAAMARVESHLDLRQAEALNRQRLAEIRKLAEELTVRNEFIQRVFGRYVTDEVVQSLLEHPRNLELGGSKREVTILMSDLRGFTGLAERLSPETVVGLLNQYLGAMATVITQYQGMIDEFIGDAILALFGAPLPRPDHAEAAAGCALAMQLEMDRVNRRLSSSGIPPLEMGIGINTGEVVVGNIGSDKRAKYGAVGAQVNLAGRIQTITVGGEILISGSTAKALGPRLKSDRTVTISVKGASAPLTLHSLVGLRDQDHLDLSRPSPPSTPPARTVSVKCYRLADSKMLIGEAFDGKLSVISSRWGILQASEALHARVDLKLVAPAPGSEGQELYCKVMADALGPFGREVRFTSPLPKAWDLLSPTPNPHGFAT